VNWMEDTDRTGIQESLETQYKTVDVLTNLSHTERYGDLSFQRESIGTFLGSMQIMLNRVQRQILDYESTHTPEDTILSRDIDLHILYKKYQAAAVRQYASTEKRAALKALAAEVSMRLSMDTVFETFATKAVHMISSRNKNAKAKMDIEELFVMPYLPIIHDDCMIEVRESFYQYCGGHNAYSTQYAGVIINACRAFNHGDLLANTMTQVCQDTQHGQAMVADS